MLTPEEPLRLRARAIRRLRHDGRAFPVSVGCATCPEYQRCGGRALPPGSYSCLDDCCRNPATCEVVCPNRGAVYRIQRAEVGGFDLDGIGPTPLVDALDLPAFVPWLDHGSSRDRPLDEPVVALPFFKVVDAPRGALRYQDHAALVAAFKVRADAALLLTAATHDREIEAWWRLPPATQDAIARALKERLGIACVASPNYSLIMDVPRHHDMHSMKRIRLVWESLARAGLAAALHLNGRTERDFERWAEFLRSHPEIGLVAFEWGTDGHRRPHRYADHLAAVAVAVGRPLRLVMRGASSLERLAGAFAGVTVVESNAFMKALRRQAAAPRPDGRLVWRRALLGPGTPIDELLAANVAAAREELAARLRRAAECRPRQ